jgi:hypothetical protein
MLLNSGSYELLILGCSCNPSRVLRDISIQDSVVILSSLRKISRYVRTSAVESKAESSARQNIAEDGCHSGGRHSGDRHPGGGPLFPSLTLYTAS